MLEEIKKNWRVVTIVLVAVLIIAVGGTIGTLYFLSASPVGERLRSNLGLENLKSFNIETTRSQKIVVEESSAFIDASKKASPAVVSITSQSNTTQRDVFGFGVIQAPQTAGTGFIVTSDGLIATNKHVIAGGDTYTVTTAAGKTYDGKVVATDPSNDFALVKIEDKGLPVVDLGDSDKLDIGQWVIAIGNALGELQNTVTVGVVSAKERTATASDSSTGSSETLYGLVQTDAAINPGNSGGPLIGLAGQVIAINTAIASSAQGIGFAIPVNELKKDLDSYRKNGKIIQPYIGVRYQPITKALAKSLNLSVDQGALLVAGQGSSAVASGSPADKAGLKVNDIVTKINGEAITDTNPLVRITRKFNPGDEITMTVLRDGKEISVKLTLGTLGN